MKCKFKTAIGINFLMLMLSQSLGKVELENYLFIFIVELGYYVRRCEELQLLLKFKGTLDTISDENLIFDFYV